MCALIETNLETLAVEDDEVDVVSVEALGFLRRRVKKEGEPFETIFFDPPYAADYEGVLNCVGENMAQLLAPAGVVIVEHHRKSDLKEEFASLKRYRVLKQGDSCLSFFEVG